MLNACLGQGLKLLIPYSDHLTTFRKAQATWGENMEAFEEMQKGRSIIRRIANEESMSDVLELDAKTCTFYQEGIQQNSQLLILQPFTSSNLL